MARKKPMKYTLDIGAENLGYNDTARAYMNEWKET